MRRRIKKSHFENVNALRFLAVLSLIFSFAVVVDSPVISNVSFYKDLVKFSINLKAASISLLLILTGFLNAHAIFEERFVYKQVNILRLYMRRLILVFPLYSAVFVVGYFLLPSWSHSIAAQSVSETPKFSYLLLVSNYFLNADHYMLKNTQNMTAWLIDNFWLLAVQIQAILIIPLLMSFFRRLEHFLIGLGILLFLAFGALFSERSSASYNLLFHFGDMMLGILLAYISFFKYQLYYKLKNISRRNMALFYTAVILWVTLGHKLMAFEPGIPASIKLTVMKLITGCLMAYVVFEQHFCSTSILKLSKIKPLNWLGDYALGLFAWYPLAIILAQLSLSFLSSGESVIQVMIASKVALSVLYSILLALISMEFIEKRFHTLRKNYQPIKDITPNTLETNASKSA